MKLPKPRQKENGMWLIEVMVNGKRVGKQFETADEAVYWAAGLKTKQKELSRSPSALTVEQAIERYIETKSVILSPSTIRGYNGIKKTRIEQIKHIRLADLTQEKVQRWVNALAKDHTPKTVANAHGLISAVLGEYRPDMVLRTTLPRKVRTEIKIPSEADLKAIIKASRGTKYELPIALAIWLGMRRSEIVGLTWDCIDGNVIHVRNAVVLGDDGNVKKGTKSYAGKRDLKMPSYIKKLIEKQSKENEFVVNLSGAAIYNAFVDICSRAGVPHYRFHDLRHANASVMLSIGVPDKYSMKRMGHATNNMLKTTYQHTIKEKEQKFDAQIDQEFERFFSED